MSRTHVGSASIQFTIPLSGVMTQLTIPGTIYSMVRGTTDKSLNTFCPDCQGSIRYDVYCSGGHGPIDRTTLLRGRTVEDANGNTTVAIIEDPDSVVKSEIARGKLTLSVVTRESLTDGTTPDGRPYHFSPTPGDAQDREAYAILRSAIADNPDLAFVCRANINRGAESLISVEAGAFGGLTLQTLAYPETLYDLPEYEVEPLSKANAKGVRMLLDDLVGEFDPEEWTDRQAAAIAEAVSEAAAAAAVPNRKGAPAKAKKKAAAASAPSLLDALSASVKAAS